MHPYPDQTTHHSARISARSATAAILLAILALAITGCAAPEHHRVESFDNRDQRLDLNAEDVVHAMRRAGFTDEQIVELGPAVRNALAVQGGARIRGGRFTDALFIASNGDLYGASKEHGSFRYTPASTLQQRDNAASNEQMD